MLQKTDPKDHSSKVLKRKKRPVTKPQCQTLTFQLHPLLKALLEPARGALLPGGDRHRTGRPPKALVVLPVLHGPLEEALARLTGENPVVEAGDLVPADRTRAEMRGKLLVHWTFHGILDAHLLINCCREIPGDGRCSLSKTGSSWLASFSACSLSIIGLNNTE